MKTGWKEEPLANLCEFERGLTYAKGDEVEVSNNVVLRATNINLETNLLDFSELRYINDSVIVQKNKKVKKGSLIICTASGSKNHLGKVAFIDNDYNYAFGGFMGMITPKTTIVPKYLFYIMTSDAYKDFIGTLSDGVNINNLTFEKLKRLPISYPDYFEQERIVRILDEAFERIVKAKVNTEKNLRNARALFESYLEGVFSQRGEGWVVKTVGEVVQKTETVNPLHSPEDEFDYIDVSSISNKTFQIEETQRLKGKDAPSRARKLVKTDDVLLATVRPTLRRIAIVPISLNDQVCSTGYFVLRPKPELDHRWVFYFLISKDFMRQMEILQKGASYPAVTDGEVKLQKIPIPPLQEQFDIVYKFDALRIKTQQLEVIYQQKLAALEELKKSLLEKAFSGEL